MPGPQFRSCDLVTTDLRTWHRIDGHPGRVADLRGEIESWRTMAEAAKVSADGEEGDVSPEELEQLRALGYAN